MITHPSFGGKDYKNKKVLILGLGLNEGGVGSARFFASQSAEVLVTDIKDKESLKPSIEKLKDFPKIKYHLGGHKTQDIDWADLIIRNWGVKRDSKYLNYAREKGKEIETDIGVFISRISPEQIIGITGSKGKTTTASLIYYALRSDREMVLVGNVGSSVLDALGNTNSETLVILEVSSFQLEAFEEKKVSPHIAVITNIFPEHLNYYQSFKEYIDSKRVIAQYQTEGDVLYLNAEDPLLNSPDFLKGLKSNIKFFKKNDLPQNFIPKLPGEHNQLSYAAAFAVAKQFGIDEQTALSCMNKFQGAQFRLQLIKEVNGIKIINDSAATNPNATIEALKTYPNCILISGGMNKGLDYATFAQAIGEYAKEVYFLEGDATDAISYQLSAISQKKVKGIYNDLTALLEAVKKRMQSGDVILSPQVILFSPGATSFNLFQNEFDRGRKFNEAVEKVFN